MIRIDFYWLVAFYLSLFMGFFFFFQLREKMHSKDLKIDPRFIWRCSVCTYTYMDTQSDIFSICPRCGCYNTRVKDTG